MKIIVILLYLSVLLSLSFVFNKHALQMFQQNHYELYRYAKWLFNRNNLHYSLTIVYTVLVLLVGTLFKGRDLLIILISIIFAIIFLYRESKKTYIKDLVVTNRVKRQIIVLFIIESLFFLCAINVFPLDVCGVLAVFMPYLFIFPLGIITSPIEELIKKKYENEARQILEEDKRLIRIGITGSYGKTSTKNIVYDIISENKLTLITPASYNTPMGITRTIREMLKPIHEVFVCEMGADKVGDITYLMDMVRPSIGVVTSIGPQHLNTFRSMDNIIYEKMQEIEMLPRKGVGFINLDNEFIANYKIRNNVRVVSVGIDNTQADLVAKKVKYSKNGSSFTVKIGRKNYNFTTSLLGKHNITNILIGIGIALELGIDIEDIVKNVKKINQVEHRLEVKKINGYTFIDDAFNSNPVGSKMALDVLQMMDGKRIIVTPGMIDLGEKEDEINREFGEYMKDRADKVVLVGEKQTGMIMEGLLSSGFAKEDITVTDNVRQAFDYIYKNFSTKDTILLENDLPDAFNV